MKFRSWAAGVLAVSLLATACGGDDTETETETETGTATETAAETETDGEAAGDRADWPEKLVIGLVPSREADVLVESAQPLADALSEALGIEVEAFVPQDYTGLTEAMASGQADIGAFGPLGIVRAQERANVDFILQSERFGSFTYHTQYMTNNPDKYCQDEPQADEDGFLFCNGTLDAEEGPVGGDAIAMLEAGTQLAFVDPSSTSGYLIPALQMQEQGVNLDELDSVFAGGHDAAVIAVVNGDVEVGLSFDDARGIVAEEFPEVGEKAVVFAYSEEIPNDGFVIRSELPDSLKQAVVEAMLQYAETEEGQQTLNEIYEIDGLREAEQGVLDVVRRADEQLGDTLEEDG
ncbi:MAG: phosphate/phosphite/phosphonate ABC transporter substrate-binding protein [Nitriliruptorales bacterium]|nr:phosphate/phosphite/phosphonate ABC transporter substrate-binding protein [Nitriliruptorales bacterium]